MTRRCFLVEDQDPETGMVDLVDETAHHVRHVLRLRAGESIELRDGRGRGWFGVIARMERQGIRITVGARQTVERESPLRLTLALAFSRSDRMDKVLRQATEMGVHGFVGFAAERSDYHLSKVQMERRTERWRKIVRDALCQCGRMRLPGISTLPDLDALMSHVAALEAAEREGLRVLAREEAEREGLRMLFEKHPACRRMLVVVGPEGGWSNAEADRFGEAGFHAVHIGPRTLRLETAAVALLASAQLLWGDLG